MTTIILYGGSVRWCNDLKVKSGGYYIVGISDAGQQRCKTFNPDRFASKESAYDAAEQYRRQISDQLGATKTRLASQLELGTDIPIHIREYIIGFCDGDGSISVAGFKDTRRATPTITFKQACAAGEPPIFHFIRHYYGGYIYRKSDHTTNQRQKYEFALPTSAVPVFAEHAAAHSVIKANQATLVLDYIAGRVTEEYATLQSKQLHAQYHFLQRVASDRLTAAYLAGIFDAEGCVGFYHDRLNAYLSQECPVFLQGVQSLHGGSVRSGVLSMNGPTACVFLRHIAPYLQVKKEQVQLVLDYVEKYPLRHKHRRSKTQQEEATQVAESVKRLKKA